MEKVVIPLKRGGAQVFVFGSRATGKYQEFSDLDIGYIANNSVDTKLIVKIKNELEDSNLPVKVDLVNLDDIPESFIKSIEHSRIDI